jgi:hypothetical protein
VPIEKLPANRNAAPMLVTSTLTRRLGPNFVPFT